MGRDLIFTDSTDLSQVEYRECLQLEQKIAQHREQLENEMEELEQMNVVELDIAYNILRETLNDLVEQNNRMKAQMNL